MQRLEASAIFTQVSRVTFTDRVSQEGKTIKQSVRPFVRPSVCPPVSFHAIFCTDWSLNEGTPRSAERRGTWTSWSRRKGPQLSTRHDDDDDFCTCMSPRPQATSTQNLVNFGRAVSEIYKRQTDRRTDVLITILRTPPGNEVIMMEYYACTMLLCGCTATVNHAAWQLPWV